MQIRKNEESGSTPNVSAPKGGDQGMTAPEISPRRRRRNPAAAPITQAVSPATNPTVPAAGRPRRNAANSAPAAPSDRAAATSDIRRPPPPPPGGGRPPPPPPPPRAPPP